MNAIRMLLVISVTLLGVTVAKPPVVTEEMRTAVHACMERIQADGHEIATLLADVRDDEKLPENLQKEFEAFEAGLKLFDAAIAAYKKGRLPDYHVRHIYEHAEEYEAFSRGQAIAARKFHSYHKLLLSLGL